MSLPLFKKLRGITGLFLFLYLSMHHFLRVLVFFVFAPNLILSGQSLDDSIKFLPFPASDSSKLNIIPNHNFYPYNFATVNILHAGNPSIPIRHASLPDLSQTCFYFHPLWNHSQLNAIPAGIFSFRRPITLTQALVSSQKEQNFYLFHSRNISPKWNISPEIEFFRTPGIISNSNFNSTRFDFSGSGIIGRQNRFLTLFNFLHFKNFGPQSGGVSDSINDPQGSGLPGNSNALLDVNYSNASARNFHTKASVETWWKFSGKPVLDSLIPLDNFKIGSFFFVKVSGADAYSFFSQRNTYDESALRPIFDTLGYNERTFLRNANLSAGWAYRKYLNEKLFELKVSSDYNHFFLSQNSASGKFDFSSVFLSANIQGQRAGLDYASTWYLSGFRTGNFSLNLVPWVFLKGRFLKGFASLKLSNLLPDYRYFFFRGNQFYWQNNPRSTQGFFSSVGFDLLSFLKFEFGRGAYSKLPRLNLDVDSVEFSDNLKYSYSKLTLEKELSNFFLKVDGCIQLMDDNDFQIGIPKSNLKLSCNYSFSLLNSKLSLSPGLDLDWFDGLYPYSFHAPTGLFGYRSGLTQRSGLIAGAFVGFRLKTFRATLRVDNFLDRVFNQNPILMIDGFPVQSRVIRFNIIWLFWD